MYQDLKSCYWWPGMKRHVAKYVSRCLTLLISEGSEISPNRIATTVEHSLVKVRGSEHGLQIELT